MVASLVENTSVQISKGWNPEVGWFDVKREKSVTEFT